MAERPKMKPDMKKSWGTEIISSIYETMSGKGSPEQQEKLRRSAAEYHPRRSDPAKVKGFNKGYKGEE